MCIYIYIYIYTHTCIDICMVSQCMYVNVCTSMYVCQCMYVNICMSMYVNVCQCMSIYVNVCQYMYVCMYVRFVVRLWLAPWAPGAMPVCIGEQTRTPCGGEVLHFMFQTSRTKHPM